MYPFTFMFDKGKELSLLVRSQKTDRLLDLEYKTEVIQEWGIIAV